MIKAGVIGHPISHSKSPLIHGAWLTDYNIDGEYKAYDISPDDFETNIGNLVKNGLSGFNVTLPYKQKILPMCATLSDEARTIGAVNTIRIDKDGLLHGYNTDAFGFITNLDEAIENFDWTQNPVTVIGAGGAARAILYALKTKNAPEIRITNRTRAAAEELGLPFDAIIFDWDKRSAALKGAGLVINTTSLGMTGQPPLDLDLDGVSKEAIIYDIVYAPLQTQLLLQAEGRGLRTVTGIGMLLHQARPAFEMWFGVLPDVSTELLRIVLPGQ